MRRSGHRFFPEIRATKFLAAVRPAVYVKARYTSETLEKKSVQH